MILQFDISEKIAFQEFFIAESYEQDFITSKKLDGDETLLQVILTSVSIAGPYIINFFSDQQKKNKQIKIISKGVEMTFKDEKELKKFLKNWVSKK